MATPFSSGCPFDAAIDSTLRGRRRERERERGGGKEGRERENIKIEKELITDQLN